MRCFECGREFTMAGAPFENERGFYCSQACMLREADLETQRKVDFQIALSGFDHLPNCIVVKHVGPAPFHGSEQASGYDLVCKDTIWMQSLDTQIVATGLRIQLPEGYEAQVRPRSSISRDGWLVHFGTIDSDYRGEIGVIVTNVGRNYRPLEAGRRIAQLCFCQVPRVRFEQVEELDATVRGERGFGSSGK